MIKLNPSFLFVLQQTENDLQAGYVEQCVRDDDYTKYPFRCSVPGSTSSYYFSAEAFPGTNCIAPDGSRDPNNVSVKVTKNIGFSCRSKFIKTITIITNNDIIMGVLTNFLYFLVWIKRNFR